MQPYEERPGTSFTSKRQVQTEQRKRQLNVGTLETEDKSAFDGQRKVRPTTQDNYQKLAMNRDRKLKNIPQAMVYDRESLYEEVINAKQINNIMQRENINLQTKVKHLEEELFRALKQASSNETLINPMESYYQEPKPSKNSLVIDLKKQVKRQKDDIRKKDQQIEQLQKSSKSLRVKELEIELLSYKNETLRLKSIISVMQNTEFENFNDGLQDTVQSLRIELIEQQAQNSLQEEQIKTLKIRLRESDSKQTKYLNEKLKKDKLNSHLKEVIESLKFKDPEFKKQNKATESEQLLKIELDSKQTQLDQLINSLTTKDQQYYELDKKMKEFEREQQQLIDQLERDRQQLKDQCNSLKEEVAQQSGRRRTVQSSFLENKLETLPEGPEITDQKHKKLLPCINKEDVLGIGRILKLKLKVARIPFNQIENFIFIDDAQSIVLEELYDTLQNQPFSLNEDESLKVARYLVEDNDEKLIEFSMEATGSAPRIKSILKNLIGNYSLIQKQEEDQLFQEIGAIFTKYRISMEDFLLKVKKSHEFCSVDDLEDALKYAEQTLQSQQYEYILLKNFEFTQHIGKIDYKKIFAYFHYEILSQTFDQRNSIPKIEINQNNPQLTNDTKSYQENNHQQDFENSNSARQVNNNHQKNNQHIKNQEIQNRESLHKNQKDSPKNNSSIEHFNTSNIENKDLGDNHNNIQNNNNNNNNIKNQEDESQKQQIRSEQQPSDSYGDQLEQVNNNEEYLGLTENEQDKKIENLSSVNRNDDYEQYVEESNEKRDTQRQDSEIDLYAKKNDYEEQELEEAEKEYQLDKLDQDDNLNKNKEQNEYDNESEENNEEEYQPDIVEQEDEKVKSQKNSNYEDEDFDQ